MARARNIKPGFFKNEQLVELPFSTRLLFAGLWTLADREGYLEDRPKRIKMEIFPGDSVDIEKGLAELHDAGLILRYAVNGARFIHIIEFLTHQHPHHKEPPSTIPKPGASPGPDTDATPPKPEIPPASHSPKALDPPHSSPGVTRLIPDSLNLIPDSGFPSTALSGKPDHSPPESKKLNGKKAEALEVLDFLNAQTGKAYRPVDANLELIAARLKEGYSVADMRKVIVRKCDKWKGDEKMEEYLRPATLFSKSKLAQYSGELVVPT